MIDNKELEAQRQKFKVPQEHHKYLVMIPDYNPYRDADGYYYDKDQAELAVDFFERVLTHVKGPLAKKPFLLEPWQKAIFMNLWGWRRKGGYRRYRRFLIYVPKKNGKTPMAAGLILLMLATDHELGAEIVGAAAAKDQASYIFQQAVGMVRNSPILNKRLKMYGAKGGSVQKRIVYEPEMAAYQIVSADAGTFDGGNLHGAVIDELHRLDDSEFIDLVEGSDIARENSLIGSITTADYNRPESPCNKRHRYAVEVCKGIVTDAEFLPVVYQTTADDDWESEETWKKANPNYGVSVQPKGFRALFEKAKREPSFTNTFKRLYLNTLTDTFQVWLPYATWCLGGPKDAKTAAEGREPLLDSLAGKTCYLGLDLSSKIDLTCCQAIVPETVDGKERYTSMSWFYAPRDRAEERAREDHVPYMAWAEQGWLTFTPGDYIDYEWIRSDIANKIAERFQVAEIAYDPWNAAQLTQRLGDEDGFSCVEVRQGYPSLSEPCKVFEAMVLGGHWRHDGNPVMSWCVSNAVTTADPAGNIKPDKAHSTERIDGVVALVTGLARALLLGGEKKSVYETRGMSSI